MNKLILLDSNSLLNRAFYALPPMSSVDGKPTNAVYGYINMLFKIINDIKPTHIIATFDLKAPTFRKAIYADYKAQRKPMPEELALQLPIIKEVLEAMKIQIVSMEGYEADDLIGTLSNKCPFETIIVTGDKDSLQLVSNSTKVWLTKRGITDIIEYDEARLLEDGLTPKGVIDLKSLMGDASDNIPGVAGVGEKTAKNLLAQYGDLNGVYEHIDEIKGKLKEKLEENKDMAYLSYQLATININSPIEFDEEKSRLQDYVNNESIAIMKQLNFKSIVSRFANGVKNNSDNAETGANTVKQSNEKIINEESPKIAVEYTSKIDEVKQIEVQTAEDLAKLETVILKEKSFSLFVEKGFNLCVSGVEYVISIEQDLLAEGLEFNQVAMFINKFISNPNIEVILYDAKVTFYQLKSENVQNFQDVSLKVYLLDANRNYKNFDEVKLDFGAESSQNGNAIQYLNNICDEKLKQMNLWELYNNIELPLVSVLYKMEKVGCRIDKNLMGELRIKFADELEELTKKIIAYNDNVSFNINSPKQLGEFLFVKLGLKHGKKTKTGFSTNADVLESLRGESEVVDLILRYRQISKLLSTYIDGLLPLIEGDRIHTIFKQTVTATGRLSSTEPNLQNIPVRKAEGKELRKMFIASEGNKLVCADYSQIELRLMAHFSEDENLIKAFNDGLDVHRFTASRAFGVPFELVTPEMRSKAKAVNFGIIYGISSFGLSNDIGITPYEAKIFIEKYFEMYPKVKQYMDNNVEFAIENGYVKTLANRIRFIPELTSSKHNIRAFGERVAMNMPLQGSASDIIKIAMINVQNALEKGGYKAKLILQVHDELLIDCPQNEVEEVKQLLLECMENVVELKVKLVADVSIGDNWLEAK